MSRSSGSRVTKKFSSASAASASGAVGAVGAVVGEVGAVGEGSVDASVAVGAGAGGTIESVCCATVVSGPSITFVSVGTVAGPTTLRAHPLSAPGRTHTATTASTTAPTRKRPSVRGGRS